MLGKIKAPVAEQERRRWATGEAYSGTTRLVSGNPEGCDLTHRKSAKPTGWVVLKAPVSGLKDRG